MSLFRGLIRESHTPGLVFEAQVCNLSNPPTHDRPVHEERLHAGPPDNIHFQERNTIHQPSVKHEIYDYTFGGKQPTLQTANVHVKPDLTHRQMAQNNYTAASINPPFPDVLDPWLAKFNGSSLDTSMCSVESDRRTPPNIPYDSGFDTCDSSPDESSCRFLNSCSKQKDKSFSSPVLENANVLSDSLLDDVNPLDLSPFSMSDLSDFSFGTFNTSDANKENIEFSPVVADENFQRRCVTPPTATRVTCPMTSHGMYTPAREFILPPPPAYTSTPFALRQPHQHQHQQQQQQQQMVSSPRSLSPFELQQPRAVSPNVPVLLVYPNGTMSSVVIPQNGVYMYS